MPRKIDDQEYEKLLNNKNVGFNHFMGGITTKRGQPEIVSVGEDLWLFSSEEMVVVHLYLELTKQQMVESKEFANELEQRR